MLTSQRAFCWDADGVHGLDRHADDEHHFGVPAARRAELDGISCGIQPDGVGVACDGPFVRMKLHTDAGEPLALPDGAVPQRVAVGPEHVCVLTTAGEVHCQGSNSHGQLGDGTIADAWDPKRVVGIPPATDIALGKAHSCARTHDGAVYCWGLFSGPPGFVPPLARLRYVDGQYAGGGSTAAQLCLLSSNGVVACRGFASLVLGQQLDGIVELAAMERAAYARNGAGEVWSWSSEGVPERVPQLEPADAFAPNATCVQLQGSKDVRCQWPYDYTNDRQPPPTVVGVAMDSLGGTVAGGVATSCGLKDGEIRCWGGLGFDWHYNGTRPHAGPSLWMPHWATTDVATQQPQLVGGAKGLVEVNWQGGCARDARGRVWRLGTVERNKRVRLALRTHPRATGATALIAGDGCVAERGDGSVFALTQPHAVAMGPSVTPDLAYHELPDAGGAAEIWLGYSMHCLRPSSGPTRCRWSERGEVDIGPFDAEPFTAPHHRIVGDGGEMCALLDDGGVECHRVRFGEPKTMSRPAHAGSTVAVQVWPLASALVGKQERQSTADE